MTPHKTLVDPNVVTKKTTNLEVMMNQKLVEIQNSHDKRMSETNPFMDTMFVLFFIIALVALVSFARSLRTNKT